MASSDPDFSRVVDEWEILKVMNRYARGVDRADAGIVRSCYHPDAYDDHGEHYYRGGVDGFADFVVSLIPTFEITRHEIKNFSVDVQGDRAFAETYVTATTRGVTDGVLVSSEFGCRFIDVFERRDDGQWLVVNRKVVYDTSRTLPADVFVAPGAAGTNTAADESVVAAKRWRDETVSAAAWLGADGS